MLNCPACGNELTPQTISPLTLHACDGGCGGLWIEWIDSETVEALQSPAPTSFTICKGDQRQTNPALQYRCPQCTNLVMNRHYVRVLDDVLVDECPSCGGIWLNAGEVDEVRDQFTQETPETALDDADTQDTEGSADQLQRARRFRQVCHYLCGGHTVRQEQS